MDCDAVCSVDDIQDTLALCSKYGQCIIPDRLLKQISYRVAGLQASTLSIGWPLSLTPWTHVCQRWINSATSI